MKIRFLTFAPLLALLGLIIFHHAAHALHVPYKRIVFDDTRSTDTLTVVNDSATPQTYAMGWTRYRMGGERGALQRIPDNENIEGVRWADAMISFEPQGFTLPPGGKQEVRLTLAPQAALEDGEYRAHVLISTTTAIPAEEMKQATAAGYMTSNISLPLFVHRGHLTAEAQMSDVTKTKTAKGDGLQLTLKRTGNTSLYGDVSFTCTGGTEALLLKTVRGIAVYTEVDERRMHVRLDVPEARREDCNSMYIEYKSRPEDALFHGKTLAGIKLDWPPGGAW